MQDIIDTIRAEAQQARDNAVMQRASAGRYRKSADEAYERARRHEEWAVEFDRAADAYAASIEVKP